MTSSESFAKEAKARRQIENSDIDPKGFPGGRALLIKPLITQLYFWFTVVV
jgi:hypothetical protein